MHNIFCEQLGIDVPLICGPMYPCSNPELVAAVSEAGAIGIVQPISLTYVHKYDFREGLRYIKSLTSKPIGLNALIEKSSKRYHDAMVEWVSIALEEGVRFFITSLGNPRWVVDAVKKYDGFVYHDVTEYKWAKKGLDSGVDGLIAVNQRAGGHAGAKSRVELLSELRGFGVPVVCAGGIGDEKSFAEVLKLGYVAAQLGTRFIATEECKASDAYKNAILEAGEDDVVLSEKITGVPVSVIKTPYIERMGLKAGPIARFLLRGRKTKHWMRTFYALRSIFQFKKSLMDESGTKEFWQAGKSVAEISSIKPAKQVVEEFASVI